MHDSVSSAPSAPEALEIFDASHITSSSLKSRSAIFVISLYSSKLVHMGFSMRGFMHVGVLLPEYLCYRPPSISAEIIWYETPQPPTPHCQFPGEQPVSASLKAPLYVRINTNSPPPPWRPFPPCSPHFPPHLPLGQNGPHFPIVPSTLRCGP